MKFVAKRITVRQDRSIVQGGGRGVRLAFAINTVQYGVQMVDEYNSMSTRIPSSFSTCS